MHKRVKSIYRWTDVAKRAENVYYEVLKMPRIDLLQKLKVDLSMGLVCGVGQVIFETIRMIVLFLCEIFQPNHTIRRNINEFDYEAYVGQKGGPKGWGNH